MQNVVTQLQEIISRHYGFTSELELKPLSSYQSLNRELYSKLDQSLSIPLFEPKTKRPIAYFKIQKIGSAEQALIDRLSDLVQMTLQSYIDLVDQLEVTDNIIQYMQLELNPHKILRLQRKTETEAKPFVSGSFKLENKANDGDYRHKEILLLSKSRKLLDNLAIHIHDRANNQFFIRTDHMPDTFLTSLNDLMGLEKATLYIPRIYQLSTLQQKTLETYFLMEKNKSNSLLIIAGTRSPVSDLISANGVSEILLKQFHLFHLLSEGDATKSEGFESLSQCASAVLGMDTKIGRSAFKSQLNLTKSYNLIPSLMDFFPTIH
jgi:hypothetical protein